MESPRTTPSRNRGFPERKTENVRLPGEITTLEFLEKNQILVFWNEFLAIPPKNKLLKPKTLHFRGKHIFLPQMCTKPIVSFKDLCFLKNYDFRSCTFRDPGCQVTTLSQMLDPELLKNTTSFFSFLRIDALFDALEPEDGGHGSEQH